MDRFQPVAKPKLPIVTEKEELLKQKELKDDSNPLILEITTPPTLLLNMIPASTLQTVTRILLNLDVAASAQ